MKIKVSFRRRFTLEMFFFVVAVFCVSSFALLEHVSISIPLFSALKWPLLYLGGACLVSQINLIFKTFLKKKYFPVWIAFFALCASLLLSAYFNRDLSSGADSVRTTLRMVLYMLELVVLMVWACEKQYGRFVVKFLFRYILILAIITDVLLFTGFVRFQNGRYEAYLVGTKFSVSYLHMNLLTLWIMQQDRKIHVKQFSRLGLTLMAVLLIAVSFRVECMTGVIGCVVLFIFLFVIDVPAHNRLKGITSPTTLGAAMGLNLGFSFVSELVVSIPFVNYFIVQILGKNDNLTGRTNIYTLFAERMQDHWLWGYGFGNSAAVELFGYANAQNAILQWILQGGLMSVLLLLAWMIVIFRQAHRSENKKRAMPLIVLVYVYIFLGTVETTFSMSFLMWIAMIFMLVNEKQERVVLPSAEENQKGETT